MISVDISARFEWLNETTERGLLLILGLLVAKPTVYFVTGAQKRRGEVIGGERGLRKEVEK